MNILIVHQGIIPVTTYGGTERVIWYLGKELSKIGHTVSYLVNKGSFCDFARVYFYDVNKSIIEQIPEKTDIVHFHFQPTENISLPYVVTMHGNCNDKRLFDVNTIFVSKNHAERFGSKSYVHNGLDWDDYTKPNFTNKKNYYHFLGNAAWRIKNVKGAIDIVQQTKNERLKVLGGNRINLNMGFRFTLSSRVQFFGMVGGTKKMNLLNDSKGLIFPVRWHEPFGLVLTESLFFGCPVFGTPYGSLPEIINSEVGFLSAIKKELILAVENNNFSPSLCHNYAVEHFNSKKMALAYIEKYMQVLSGKKLNEVQPKLLRIQNEKFLPFINT